MAWQSCFFGRHTISQDSYPPAHSSFLKSPIPPPTASPAADHTVLNPSMEDRSHQRGLIFLEQNVLPINCLASTARQERSHLLAKGQWHKFHPFAPPQGLHLLITLLSYYPLVHSLKILNCYLGIKKTTTFSLFPLLTKKIHHLKFENYILFGRQNWGLKIKIKFWETAPKR